jgi:predicted dehydrogenase
MEKLTAAVIGCGRMGAFTSESIRRFSPLCWLPLSHIEALQNSNRIDLKAICDISTELVQKASAQHSINNTFTDYQQLLEQVKPDILTIATRTLERVDIINAGIQAGVKAFHIEKPLCNSIEQLNTLQNKVENQSIYFSYGTIRRYFSIYKQAKQMVDEGKIGKLQQISINFGEGPLFWSHPHSVDMLLFFANDRKVTEAQASLKNLIKGDTRTTIESDPIILSASVYFEDDVVGLISRANGTDVVLTGSEGEITIEGDGRSLYYRGLNDDNPYMSYPSEKISIETPAFEGTYGAIAHLINLVDKDDKNKDLSSHPIFLGQRILFSLVQSELENGRRVNLENIDPSMYVLAKTGDYLA